MLAYLRGDATTEFGFARKHKGQTTVLTKQSQSIFEYTKTNDSNILCQAKKRWFQQFVR